MGADNGSRSCNPLATPPAEPDTPPLPVTPLADVVHHDTLIVDKLTAKLQSATSGQLRQRRDGPVLREIGVPLKGGDAAGQPRKGDPRQVETEPYIEMSAIQKMDPKTNITQPFAIAEPAPQSTATPQSLSTAASTSTRGIKRAATRLPIPDMTRNQPQSTGIPRLAVPIPLHRTSSTSSVASSVSEIHRPPRKRTAYKTSASSPLSRNGLSSPPTSRESSPAEDDDTIMGTSPVEGSKIPVSPLRLTKQFRKIPADVPPVDIEEKPLPAVPGKGALRASPGHAETRRSILPAMRSMIPRSKAAASILPSVKGADGREMREKAITPSRRFGL